VITHFVHQSVDGYIHGPNGEFDWPVMGPELSDYAYELTASATSLYGRKVWDLMVSYWPTADEHSSDPHDARYAQIWREQRKIVVSSTLTEPGWNTEVVRRPEDLGDEKLLLFGGATLAKSLTDRGLVDQYLIFVHPVVLGGGLPSFLDLKDRLNFRLAESRVFDGQVVMLRYEAVRA
jgi:dihydrofolate reductase